MPENKNGDALSFLAGGLLGAAVGAVIALLFAPTTGTQTRRRLKKQTLDIAKEVNKAIQTIDRDTIQPAVKDTTDFVKEKIDDAATNVKQTVNSINKTKIKASLDNAKDYATEKIDQAKKAVIRLD